MIASRLLRYLPPPLRRRIANRSYLLRVIDNTGWIATERIVRHVIGFAIGVAIARHLGPQQYGLLNYASSFVLVFAFIATLGFDSIAVREMVRRPETRDETLGTLLLMRLAGGFAMLLAIALAMIVLPAGDPRAPPLIIIISVAQLLLFTDAIDCWFQANIASRYTVLARLGSFLAGALIRVGLVFAAAPLIAFAWAALIESCLLSIAMLAVYRRSGERLQLLRATRERARAFVGQGWPLFASALVVAVAGRIDQVILGQIAGYTEVGGYAIAVRIVEATYIIPAVIATSIFPAMIRARAADAREYERQVQRLYDLVLWLSVAVAVPLSLLAAPIVRLLVGGTYAHAAAPLAILSWMPIFVFFGLVRQRWLLAEGALAASLGIEITACALSVLGNLLLIPTYGAAGAAMAAIVAGAGTSLLVAPFSRPVRVSLSMLVRALLAPLRLLRST